MAWVRLTGQRIAISRWRRARTALRSWVRHGEGSPLPGPGPESVALVEALRRLPEAQRSALVLHHMGGRAVAEIAAEEGVPVGTVKARLHRGRQALAELLGEEDGEGGLRMPLRQPEVPSGPKSASAPKPGQPPRPRSEPEQQRGAAEAGPAPAVPEQRSGRERNLKRTLSARG
ncbi:RNA polymerase sigma factor [Kitasatospora gansuensis]